MEGIVDILVASQEILNIMDRDDREALEILRSNEKKLKLSIMKSKEPSIYKKYLVLHEIILQSAQEFIITGNWAYKLQPFIHYHNHDFSIEGNSLKLLIKGNMVRFDSHSKKIEILDELYLEHDQLFEKRHIPIILKTFASQRDKDSIMSLRKYIEDLIQLAQCTIENDDIL